MRVITFNANGIRSAASKGFCEWFRGHDADVLCLQETKAQEDQLADALFRPDGHHCFYRDASTRKGYSGVAIWSRREPDEVRTALGWAPFEHYADSVWDSVRMNAIAQHFAAAFLDRHLKGEAEADLYLDPQMVGWGFWKWEQPGLYFGIPLVNFAGWFAVAAGVSVIIGPRRVAALPLLVIYGVVWVFQAIGLAIFWGQPGPAFFGFCAMGLMLGAALLRARRTQWTP